MGLCDSYPSDHPIATPHRLKAIETEAVRWRWNLKSHTHRTRRIHGDFHPFNLLFREGTDFSVLDCSRGGVGEPADDLAAMSINYIFFSLQNHRLFHGALREIWNVFWHTYLSETEDLQVLDVIAPFFVWRCLVLASPVWYPNIPNALRDRLLQYAERLLENEPFHPDRIDELLG
jgi:Ser/Thr protein kinase RdoA (MazF antagonist)